MEIRVVPSSGPTQPANRCGLQDGHTTPTSAWRRIERESVSRIYKTPRVLDRRVVLNDYEGPIRQLTIADLGHEDPTLLLTNQLTRSASHLIGRYAWY